MDFKKAVDVLSAPISAAMLADELGVSLATVRQAKLAPSAKAHRTPPQGWQRTVAKLARQRAKALLKLADQLD